ncbi:hypothetical protein ACFQV4_18390 [Streptomyces thermocarboxydus]
MERTGHVSHPRRTLIKAAAVAAATQAGWTLGARKPPRRPQPRPAAPTR